MVAIGESRRRGFQQPSTPVRQSNLVSFRLLRGMSGHDGKRGLIQHLAVEPKERKSGIGTKLLDKCLDALKMEGIIKSHIHVVKDNGLAKDYWINRGWIDRSDISVFPLLIAAMKTPSGPIPRRVLLAPYQPAQL